MAPIKLEDNMKERLEERTIEPTTAAWDRISSKLDAEQGVKKSKRVLWMSIAASFVGGALVTLFLFQNMNTDTTPVLVNGNETPVLIDPTEEVQPLDIKEDEILQEVKEAVVLEEEAVKNEKSLAKTTISSQNNSLEKNKTVAQVGQQNKNILESNNEKKLALEEDVIVANTGSKEIENAISIREDNAFAKAITEKTDTAIAENNDSLIDAEIEALLKNAQREIINNQTFNPKANTVDANALLLDVEAEVAPTSFRNKIFEAVIDGFERTKDAVVNRNN